MHLALKQEATRHAGANLLQQQAKFDQTAPVMVTSCGRLWLSTSLALRNDLLRMCPVASNSPLYKTLLSVRTVGTSRFAGRTRFIESQ